MEAEFPDSRHVHWPASANLESVHEIGARHGGNRTHVYSVATVTPRERITSVFSGFMIYYLGDLNDHTFDFWSQAGCLEKGVVSILTEVGALCLLILGPMELVARTIGMLIAYPILYLSGEPVGEYDTTLNGAYYSFIATYEALSVSMNNLNPCHSGSILSQPRPLYEKM